MRLIIRPGAIGDTLLAFPAMEFVGGEVWVRAEMVPLARFAAAARSIQATGLGLLGLEDVEPPAALLDRLASFDEIVTWYGSAQPAFRRALERIHPRVRFLDALPTHAQEHAADFFLRQVGGKPPAIPRIAIDRTAPRGTIAIHPSSGSARKNWPRERFAELAHAYPCESAADRFDNLAELASWLTGASLYVGNDSGITHLAAAVGVPVLALFGPTDPAVWAPRPARVIRAASMEAIPVDAVRKAIDEMLNAAAAKPAAGEQR